jgi:sialate O-acetylesterase
MKTLLFIALLIVSPAVFGELQLASVFSDNMVLQRDKPVPVWGTGAPGEKVLVEIAGQTQWGTVDRSGNWRVQLDPLNESSTPQMLWVVAPLTEEKTKVSNVLVGDVWLCGGQSNMKWNLGGTLESQDIIQQADHPNLRLLQVPKNIQSQPTSEFSASWVASSPATVSKFSAVGYLFGQRIHRETDVPIGLILCAEGSTSVECWVSNETLESDLFSPAITKWRDVEANWDDPAVRAKHIHKTEKRPEGIQPSDARTYPGGCYNGMLNPLFPFAIKGVVWYQGEANRLRGQQYQSLFPAMVQEWRSRFEQDDFKFYQVQLPEIGKPSGQIGDSPIAELREAQQMAADNDPLIEMAVIIDSDQGGNIHPKNKQLPGNRLARIALTKDYGKGVEFRGPVFSEMKIKGNRIFLSFDHLGGELVAGKRTAPTSLEVVPEGDELANFAVAGADQIFHPARAKIDGDVVMVQSDEVKNPVAVRYAWADNPVGCNFYNAAGLPASPFRTDDWPLTSAGHVEGKVLVIR